MFRYAPTPSGFLHIGNGVNFVLTYLLARALGQPVLLRIDDLDADRKRPEYVEDVFRTLDFLGLTYDKGPSGPDDFERNWSQRHRLPLYEALLDRLVERGRVYACGLSRQQLRTLSVGDSSVARQHMRAQHLPLETPETAWRVQVPPHYPFTDFIVRRRDGVPAYQVASLADDVHFGITHLVRGNDLRESTAMQRYLAELTGQSSFLSVSVWHHPLMTGDDGIKLSKSAGSLSLMSLRQAGATPGVVYETVARLLGLPTSAGESLATLEKAFRPENMDGLVS